MTRRQSKEKVKRLIGSRKGKALICKGKVLSPQIKEAESTPSQAQHAKTVIR